MHNEVDGVAFVTYETPMTPCGGIAAVMKYLPDSIQRASSLRTVILAPYHHQLLRAAPGADARILRGVVGLPDAASAIQMHLWQWQFPGNTPQECEWIYCLPDDPGYFAGERHPYDIPAGQDASLVRDALAFGAAVPRILHVLGPGMRWAVLMQDWEGAATALAFAGKTHNHALYLTLHNSYDSGTIADEELRKVGINPLHCQGARPNGTLLDRALRLVRQPVLTVSQGFARDLQEDPFQCQVMTPHLQHRLRGDRGGRIIGIDNGPFATLSVPADVLEKSRRLSSRTVQGIRPLRAWKRSRRAAFCKSLEQLLDATDHGSTRPLGTRTWGGLTPFLEVNAKDTQAQMPWFVMGGRDDPRQKGYDVAVEAARSVLEAGIDACFLWFPIPGDEGLNGLRFLADLAWDFPSRVLVFPFVFREGYMDALQGSTYALMPSFYEPFGAANEFYLQGTVGLGRATGGLVQQLVPLREVKGWPEWSSYTPSVAARTEGWHAASVAPTGILFREPDALPSTVEDWHGINTADYTTNGVGLDRIAQRRQFSVWLAMAEALTQTMKDAVQLYKEHPLEYDQLLLDGIAHIESHFSWEQAAQLYLRFVAPHSLRSDPPSGR